MITVDLLEERVQVVDVTPSRFAALRNCMNENARGVWRSSSVVAVTASVHRWGPVVAAHATPRRGLKGHWRRRRPRVRLRILSRVGVIVVRPVARLQLVEVRIQPEADVASLLRVTAEIPLR